ncbi:hypothetical protein NEAUS05_1158 [Nematocida ausubeli]|nr:hypothetical protein NEAUS07_0987 [Nematocida ausubeli]KAI5147877.1 hypothetical protein NEAUS05_1158 [Nematocida ausubeli]
MSRFLDISEEERERRRLALMQKYNITIRPLPPITPPPLSERIQDQYHRIMFLMPRISLFDVLFVFLVVLIIARLVDLVISLIPTMKKECTVFLQKEQARLFMS